MSKEVILNVLNTCENGHQMLQFIDGLFDYQNEQIAPDAYTPSGEPVNFW